MFTGLVQGIGVVTRVEASRTGARLIIDPGAFAPAPAPGDSICVSGCCLTAAPAGADAGSRSAMGGALQFDVVAETLARTTFGSLRPGSRVNLERSLRPDSLLGGHVVQGHVDGTGSIVAVHVDGDNWRTRVRAPAELLDAIVPKGSIAVDGVSLTIAKVEGDEFEVALIPTTLELTTLRELRAGDRCNLESDILARTVVHWLRRQAEARRA